MNSTPRPSRCALRAPGDSWSTETRHRSASSRPQEARVTSRALVAGAALGLVLVLAATGCGSGSSASPAGSGGSSAADRPKYGSEEFGLSTEELAVRIEKVEAAIGQCMQQAGFDYVPVDFDTVYAAMASSGSTPGVTDEEYLAQFGFGITTRVGQPDPVVVNGRGAQNVAIFDALAPGDRVAYQRALWGENTEVTLARALENEDFSNAGGCTLAAVQQHFGTEELSGSYANPNDALMKADPRMIAAIADWSACLAEAGYHYDNPDALDSDLTDQLAAVMGGAKPTELDGAARGALTELQGFERSVAQVAASCEEDHIVPVEEQIQSEIFGAPQP